MKFGKSFNIIANEEKQTALYRSETPIALTHNFSNVGSRDEAIISHIYYANTGHEQQSFSREKVSRAVLHRHDFFEVLFVMEGEVALRIEREIYILHPGDACIINRSTRHMEINDRNYAVIFLQLSAEYIRELLTDLPSGEKDGVIMRFFFDNLSADHPYQKDYILCTPANKFEAAYNMGFYLKTMESEFTQRAPGFLHFIRGLTLRFFVDLQKPLNYETKYIQLSSSSEEEIFDCMTAFIEYKHGRVTRNSLSEELGYSGHYLNEIMKKYTGMTITEYSQQIRLRAAAEQLEKTDDSITAISTKLGFENRSYFYRIFKAQFEMTPVEYRNYLRR